MSTNKQHILLEKYFSNTCTREELDQLFTMIEHDSAGFTDMLKTEWEKTKEDNAEINWETKFEQMMQQAKFRTPVIQMNVQNRRVWHRISAAASVILLLTLGGYLFYQPSKKEAIIKQALSKNDVLPGSNKAILTLGNGSTIILDTAPNGTLSEEGDTKVVKLEDGELSYAKSNENSNEVVYNIISTPRGGQYQVVLPDGSKVWLNASSTLRFPTAFRGNERNVELNGEGYFEVAHLTPPSTSSGRAGQKRPFIVNVNGVKVEVLGTHFNVNAYHDEGEVKTTLLEGSVSLSTVNSQQSIAIKPGEQATVKQLQNSIEVQKVDINEAVAWKEGQFNFKSTNITAIMRQVSRWYDVDIDYKGNVSGLNFSGIISRKENISRILNVLEATGTVHFKIEDKRITVTP